MAQTMAQHTGRRCFLTMAGVGAGVVAAGLPITSCGGDGLQKLKKDVDIVLADHPKLAEVDRTVLVE